MTDRMLLRVMARKSIFLGGKHEGLSVQMLLNLGNNWALVYRYYRYDTISYLPDILDELGITEKWRIKKPGSNMGLYEEWKKAEREKESDLDRMKRASHEKRVKKAKLVKFEKTRFVSKAGIMNKHRGHKKQSSTGKTN